MVVLDTRGVWRAVVVPKAGTEEYAYELSLGAVAKLYVRSSRDTVMATIEPVVTESLVLRMNSVYSIVGTFHSEVSAIHESFVVFQPVLPKRDVWVVADRFYVSENAFKAYGTIEGWMLQTYVRFHEQG